MSDKKIVDDYYSQSKGVWNNDNTPEKKNKIQIKWKIKVKKESLTEEFFNEDKKETDAPILEVKNKVSMVKNIKIILESPKNSEVKIKKDIIIAISTGLKKEYFTKKWIEKQVPKSSEYKWKHDGVKNTSYNKKPNIVDSIAKPVEEKKPWSWFQKEWGYSTWLANFSSNNSWGNTSSWNNFWPNNSWGAFKVFEHNKDTKFWKKTTKSFDDKSVDDKGKKLFKKDKSNKYSKNIVLEEDDSFSRSNKMKHIKKEEKSVEDIKQNLTDRSGETVIIPDILSVKELSEKIWVPLMKLITEFMKNGMKVTINSKIDYDTATIVSETFNIKLQKDISSWFHVEDMLSWDISSLLIEEDKTLLNPRPPVISIMWHVDHGKTSLLDYIRKSKIVDKEAGWITQSIWAYQVEYNWEKITFLDTPGHEAFTIMRARWAKSTDIAILVVAADEWVKPQTIESINHAREAWIQIVVAINKMDKEWANPDFVKWQLAQYWLQPEDWWGDIPMVNVSAKTWLWIDELLEIIILSSQLLELKANSNRLAVWTVLESHLDMKLGPVSSVLINTGTLNKWDSIVCKWSYGKVKVLKDYHSKNIHSAWPSTPVLVVWLDSVCDGWDIIQVVSDIEKARTKALEYKELMSSKKSLSSSSIDLIMLKIKSWNLKQLKAVVKADTNWSLEAIKWALIKLSTPETKVTIIHSWVGNITEWDVLMCQWSSALLIWYNVNLLWNTKNIIEDTKIEYISSKVIYHITERVEKIVTGMLDPKEVEIQLWNAIVAWIFYEDKWFMILWLKLKAESKIEKQASVRIIRKDKFMWNGKIESLKSWVIDVNDLEWPLECWIKLKSDIKVEMWDFLEIYKIEIQK